MSLGIWTWQKIVRFCEALHAGQEISPGAWKSLAEAIPYLTDAQQRYICRVVTDNAGHEAAQYFINWHVSHGFAEA